MYSNFINYRYRIYSTLMCGVVKNYEAYHNLQRMPHNSTIMEYERPTGYHLPLSLFLAEKEIAHKPRAGAL